MKYIFSRDALLCTIFIVGFIGAITNLPFETEIFDPVAKAFEDMEMSDLVFSIPEVDKKNVNKGGGESESKFFRGHLEADTNIVLVNIQHLSRAEVARQIEILNKYEPSVIGIDAFFRKDKDPMQDFPLEMALSQVKNLVLVSELESPNGDCFDSLSTSNPKFNQYAHNGFANVSAAGEGKGYRTVKDVLPTLCYKGETMLNFTSKILQLHDSAAFERLSKRTYEKEIINWRGHYDKFYALDWNQVLNETFNPSIIKGKVVLMGYIGPYLGGRDLEDIFFTPQNHRVAGRSYPDTYGVVVHANILSMYMHGNYIYQLPEWTTHVMMLLIVYFNIALFLYVAEKRKTYYDLITKTFQLFEVMIFMFFIVYLMKHYSTKVHLQLLFIAVLLSGDLTELYAGSVKPIFVNLLTRFGVLKPKD